MPFGGVSGFALGVGILGILHFKTKLQGGCLRAVHYQQDIGSSAVFEDCSANGALTNEDAHATCTWVFETGCLTQGGWDVS